MKLCSLVRSLAFTIFVAFLAILVSCSRDSEPNPFFRQDLHPFGFITEVRGPIVGNFTDINFLSNELVLVTLNTRVYGSGPIVVEPFSDQPVSKLLLFDISQRKLLRTRQMPIEKAAGSVKATHDGGFVLLNESGLHLCSPELECRLQIPARGPLFVSPEGTRIVIGGNDQTEQELVDSASLADLQDFPSMDTNAVIPGDNGLLVRKDTKLYVRLPATQDRLLPFGGDGVWPSARFLNRNTLADFESDKALTIAKIDGTILFRVPVTVTARWNVAEITTASSGSQFCFHQAGYTTVNSILNFYDIESGRPLNFESVNVISIESGRSLLKLRWDPRPYVGLLTPPAFAPNGRRLAIVRHGFLEVFEVR